MATNPPSTSNTAVPSPAPTSPPVIPSGSSKLFGPFDIPPTQAGGWPFSVTRYAYQPQELDAACRNGLKVLIALTGGHNRYTDENGCFSLDMWKAALDANDLNGVQPYVDNGTIVGLYAIDEPHDWGNDCGPTYSDLNAVCEYAHARLPGIACGVNTSPEWLEQGLGETDFGAFDYLFTQYNWRQGDIHEWINRQFAHARWFDGDIWLSLNVVASNPTPAQIEEVGVALCQANVRGVTMWKWGERFSEPGMVEAMGMIAAACH